MTLGSFLVENTEVKIVEKSTSLPKVSKVRKRKK